MNAFLERINHGEILVADGATGSNLQERGLPPGKTGEVWVLENPDEIIRLEKDFITAGSDVILTCTFSASRQHLKQFGLADKTAQINRTAVKLAKTAIGTSKVLIAGDIGPIGEMLEPYGSLTVEAAQASFAEQAQLLAEAGTDLILIETMFDLNEAITAVRGVRSVCSLPVVCSISYDRGTRTMMGLNPTKAGLALLELGVAMVGINCGHSLEDNYVALQELHAAIDLPIWFKPNAGLPLTDEFGRTYYDLTPEGMAAGVPDWIAAGAHVIGGCCGTDLARLAAVAAAVKAASH